MQTAPRPDQPGLPRPEGFARLQALVGAATFELAGREREDLAALRDRLTRDLDHHATRARDVDAPLLVVIGGVTGAGKSTVTNTLVGRDVVATGVIRPTTTQPTLVCHPADTGWFTSPRILTGLSRQVEEGAGAEGAGPGGGPPKGGSQDGGAPGTLRVQPAPELEEGVALLDAPDVDSVSAANRDLADLLLDAADLWLWFTTPGKYADEESMRYLVRAGRRGIATLVVLTQLRPEDRDAVVEDFRRKLTAAEVEPEGPVVVPWVDDREGGRLPASAVTELTGWLDALADPDERRARRRATLRGAVEAMDGELGPLVTALTAQRATADDLLATLDRTFDGAVEDFSASLDDGLPLRGEILGRWTEYVGSNRLTELAGQVTGTARRWVGDLLRAPAGPGERRLEREVKVEVADTVGEQMRRTTELAVADTVDSWRDRPEARAVVARIGDTGAAGTGAAGAGAPAAAGAALGEDLGERCADAVRRWQDAVVDLVAEQGLARRARARWMSTGINAVATGLIVVALASTGGLTGAEAGIATAAGAANQALLTAVLGERTVRWLVTSAREDLVARFRAVLAPERAALADVVEKAAPDDDLADRIRTALGELGR